MPELPDVEVIRRYLLSQDIQGSSFKDVTLHWPKAVRQPSPNEFVSRLIGATIRSLGRRAKFLVFGLDEGTLIVHLRMTGSLVVVSSVDPVHRFARTVFDLDDSRRLLFVDGRKLGAMWLTNEPSSVIGHLGPEPLSQDFTLEVLKEKLRGRGVPIKPLLLDQGLVAGIGNIYADEILFVARLNPLRTASDLSGDEATRLYLAIRTVLSDATEKLAGLLPIAGPPTESEEGSSVLLVTRREGAACPNCEERIVREVIRGRSAYLCPACQALH